MIKHIFIGGVFAVLVWGSESITAQNRLGIENENATSIGIYIKDLKTGRVIADRNSSLALMPASVMKVVTTASALHFLGENFRFTTDVSLTGNRSKDNSGVWEGNLVVRSVGDPTIESENFKGNLGFCDSIVSNIRRLGIKEINGRIIVEQTLSNAGQIPEWQISDVACGYGAGLYGFNFMDNTLTVTPATGNVKPYAPGLEIERVTTTAGNQQLRGINSNQLFIFARSFANKKWVISTTMPDPSAVFTAQLMSRMSESGISLTDKTVKTGDADASELVYCHKSPASKDIFKSLMVRSDNLFAEGMLRATLPGDSRYQAIKKEKELWTERGLSTKTVVISDGSGLARTNRLSPRFIAGVLEYMAKNEKSSTFVSFFPKAGKDGTMKGFLAKTPLQGKIAMKTGSVNGVQCYAGYKLGVNGKPTHVVVIMVNNFFCSRQSLRKAIEAMLTKTFR